MYEHSHDRSHAICSRRDGMNSLPHHLHSLVSVLHALTQPVSWQKIPLIVALLHWSHRCMLVRPFKAVQ